MYIILLDERMRQNFNRWPNFINFKR